MIKELIDLAKKREAGQELLTDSDQAFLELAGRLERIIQYIDNSPFSTVAKDCATMLQNILDEPKPKT
jgi:hypothetical protein